ncbi:flagellar hook assembly protein FlgD [Piscinibacter sakaiensis]|uniref:Basal-body rod modification protein FlgD n=1 Tax=Piscinibacter sakaiensis TaxID=1547922 RepID=A0A0K8NTP4_PISS1|nr:flagellar hook assembly protein FlgD [Piscinibacter sakaiensis]GAP33752.1 flagellar basal-body rod modification protein FlgD [Piscinibacter sakaiensis]
MSTTIVNNLDKAMAGSTAGSSAASNDTASADRFLKLLVTQMQNQDPLNPMDNAQVTSQMAQINTVTGIDKLNTTIQGLSSQFSQMQVLQGAGLVGRDVMVEGKTLSMTDRTGEGGFVLANAADDVQIEVLSPAGQVLDTVKLGAQSAGTHSFSWTAGEKTDISGALSFRVKATTGGVSSTPTALSAARVESVQTTATGALQLQLSNGKSVGYADIKAFG